MIVIGVDNGINGGIVAVRDDGKLYQLLNMPVIKGDRTEYDIQELVRIFENFKREQDQILVILEKAHVMPLNGRIACFSTGYCFGMMQGILSALSIPYQIVHAKTWQKEIFKDMNGTDTKQKSILFCKRMFPDQNWKVSERSKKDHDGLTDATSMACYGLRFISNKGVSSL